jgi:hypothetical protein
MASSSDEPRGKRWLKRALSYAAQILVGYRNYKNYTSAYRYRSLYYLHPYLPPSPDTLRGQNCRGAAVGADRPSSCRGGKEGR